MKRRSSSTAGCRSPTWTTWIPARDNQRVIPVVLPLLHETPDARRYEADTAWRAIARHVAAIR